MGRNEVRKTELGIIKLIFFTGQRGKVESGEKEKTEQACTNQKVVLRTTKIAN